MCEKKTLPSGTRVQVTFDGGKTASGTVVCQYDTEPYDDTVVDFDYVYSWVDCRTVRRFWFLPMWFFPKKVRVLCKLGKGEHLHSSDLRPLLEK